jgi:AcrR family transcriptional regulator
MARLTDGPLHGKQTVRSVHLAAAPIPVMSRNPNTRAEILDAAEAVIAEHGAGHLTLDAVAEHAGISKGGLLYNFPSKEALLKALLARLLERCNSDRCEARARELAPEDPAGDLKALVLAGFQQAGDRERVSGALLAAGAADPRLLSPVREWHQANFRELSVGKRHPLRVLVLMLAMDGFWLNELLHTSPFGTELKEQLMAELFSLADAAV